MTWSRHKTKCFHLLIRSVCFQFSRDQFILDCSLEKLRRELEEELKMNSEEPRSHAWYHGAIPRQVKHTHTHTNLSHVSHPLKVSWKTCWTRSPIIILQRSTCSDYRESSWNCGLSSSSRTSAQYRKPSLCVLIHCLCWTECVCVPSESWCWEVIGLISCFLWLN